MQPILLTTQLIDETGARFVRLVVVPVKRGEAAPGAISVHLAMAHTGAALGLKMPPSGCKLPPGRVVDTAWGWTHTPHTAQWPPNQPTQDIWETIMACSNFTAVPTPLPDDKDPCKGLFYANISVGLMPDTAEGEVMVMELDQWTSPAGRLAWLVALGKHLADPAADNLRLMAARRSLSGEVSFKLPRPDQHDEAARRCADEVGRIMREWTNHAPNSAPTDPAAAAAELIGQLIERMERIGEWGEDLAKLVREMPGERAADELMMKRVDDVSFDAPLLGWIIEALWCDMVALELERHDEHTTPIADRMRVVQEGGALYSQMPKVGGATTWGWGGTGDENSGALEGFGVVPGLVRYLPHGHALTPEACRPAHTQIPVGLEGVGLVLPNRGNRFVLTPTEGKLLLLVFATSQGARTSLGRLTVALNKGKKRIRARDHERTAEALHTLRQLRLALPDKTDITLFSVRAPVLDGGPYEDRDVSWCATDHLRQLQRGALPGAEALKLLRGLFVYNLSKALEFTDEEAAHLRAYMYACAMWNDAGCNSDKILTHTMEQWAAATNQLSAAAVEYLEGNKSSVGRASLPRDKKKAWEVLKKLEADGLLMIEGDKRNFKLLPIADHLAAFKKYSSQQANTLAFLGLNIDGC